MLKKSLFIAFALVASHSATANPSLAYPIGKPTLSCVRDAAQRYNLPFELLLGINSVELGRTGQYIGNKNGTKDTGAFQINSIHYRRAQGFGVSPADLASRGCYNAQFAAMLVSEALNNPKKQYLDYYTRAAGYHSWTPKYNSIYRAKLVAYTNQWREWLKSHNVPPSNPSYYPINNGYQQMGMAPSNNGYGYQQISISPNNNGYQQMRLNPSNIYR